MSDHGLIEPVPRNFTKEDYWSLWCLFCTTVANQMEPGPAQDRVLSYSFFNARQLGSDHWARDLGNISTKWGSLVAASFILHRWDFRFRCGGITYEITIDFSKIQDFFPEEVLTKRYSERPPEKDRLLSLSRKSRGHYTHDFYEYSFYPATKKFAETAKSRLKALALFWW